MELVFLGGLLFAFPTVQVAKALAECAAFAQASHVHWGVWSVLQARYSAIDFDYFEYSEQRWARYHAVKAETEDIVCAAFAS